ncbi:MAG: hypothetical protein SGI77_07205 [Pirellulaceae bacterium]|nr:hypothetical protein [Pirellulaceae bacterium]
MPSRALIFFPGSTTTFAVLMWISLLAMYSGFALTSFAQESTVVLKSGMTIGPGKLTSVSQVDDNAISSIQTETFNAKPIIVIDDDLRVTYVNQNLIANMPPRATPLQRIETGNASLRASGSHSRIAGVQAAVSVTPFDPFGRRVYSLLTPQGQADVLQGITEISGAYVKVEALNADKTYIWDMRLALNAVPADRLREIFINHANPDPQSWLNIVAVYSDAKRYIEARDFLLEAIRRFPELENQRAQVKQFYVLLTSQMFEEVELRSKANQIAFAESLLRGFPLDRLSLETKLKINGKLSEIVENQSKVKSALEFIRADAEKIANEETKKQLAPFIEEINRELTQATLLRLSDYNRLRDDKALSDEQRLAIAIGGWFMGFGESETNLPVMLSVAHARDLVQKYLTTNSIPERESLIDRLKTMEGGNPKYVAKLLKLIKPPLPLPESENAETGRFVIEVPNSAESSGMVTKYSIQLPPEYDPNLRYPCIVSLHSQFSGPQAQLEWWTGPYNPDWKMCLGEASRHGYIVIAPHWTKAKQPLYNYTEDEHARVLRSLRDAMRRTSIDADRVFLCGHHMGGDAVWDMALAHPDIWAGAIAIGADCEKYAILYGENARYVPLYFVVGALDGAPAPRARNGKRWDEFLKNAKVDCMLTLYHGRGRDHFQEEQPRLIEWMKLSKHRRPPPPKDFTVKTARASDRAFWWLEVVELTSDSIVNPLLFKPGKPAELEASLSVGQENSIRVKFPGKQCVIWLSPETVDFSKRFTFQVRDRKKSMEIRPNLSVLLEDARTRADRQYPYWEKVEF